jgi:hypothetical protein
MASLAEDAAELIHDAAGDAGPPMLGLLAEECLGDGVELFARERFE